MSLVPTGARRVAILHLGSASSMGGRRRVESLAAIFRGAGADVIDIPLLADHRPALSDVLRPGLVAATRGHSVPESMGWSRRSVIERLGRLRPDVVVCSTARAFHPDLLAGPWTVVVDYVDRLSGSYRDRSRIVGASPRAALFRSLAVTARRFEQHRLPNDVIGIAAGWDDAQALDLEWVPITVDVPTRPPDVVPTHDALFLGKLSYPPNVEAILRLGRLWPAIQDRRPGTTLLLAGAAPSAEVQAVARAHGWTVMADFADLATVLTSARVAVAPLLHASGIQIKVLDAAAFGVPQVIGPVVANGFGPGLPAAVADGDTDLVSVLTQLIADPAEQARLGAAALAHVAAEYSVARWVPWAAAVLDRAARPAPIAVH